MKDIHILIVEDELAVASLLKINLELAGFHVSHAMSLKSAQVEIAAHLPDIIVLDWMLPDGNGLSLLHNLRHHDYSKNIGVIMLTAKAQEDDKLQGLGAGADDYLTKPFSHKELIARIQALLRRRYPEVSNELISIEGLTLNPNLLEISYHNQKDSLGNADFKLLLFMMTHAGRLFTRAQLLDRVWKNHTEIEERTIDVHIKRIREALHKVGAPDFIKTVRGNGYRFEINKE